jgi:uncharacterized protein with GYD domain
MVVGFTTTYSISDIENLKTKLSRVEEYRNSLEAKGYSLYLNNYWTQIIFHIVGIFE